MPKIRVLVVDDAVVMRKLISEALSRDVEIEVVGVAANGRIALQKVPQLNPDLITLDIEMPEMDGLETLRELRQAHPKLPVIMFSTLTTRAATATLDALSLGAVDYVAKPANVGSVTECIDRLQGDLVAKIKVHCRHLFRQTPPPSAIVPQVSLAAPARVASRVPGGLPGLPEVVCIATSTGGPNALAELFRGFPGGFHLPLLIVQHMPPLFTAMLAERLNKLGSVKFYEGAEGQTVQPGQAYIAPGGKHMEIRRSAARVVLHLQEEAPENSCRPAADVLFRSAVSVYGGNILGVVMTGMGQDGLRGCEMIRERGGHVVVQDEPSSVVWGMPGSVAQAGFADKIVPLDQIAGEIVRRTRYLQPAIHT
jgi:two-component system chemotaxis response regulator CheB